VEKQLIEHEPYGGNDAKRRQEFDAWIEDFFAKFPAIRGSLAKNAKSLDAVVEQWYKAFKQFDPADMRILSQQMFFQDGDRKPPEAYDLNRLVGIMRGWLLKMQEKTARRSKPFCSPWEPAGDRGSPVADFELYEALYKEAAHEGVPRAERPLWVKRRFDERRGIKHRSVRDGKAAAVGELMKRALDEYNIEGDEP